MNGKISFDEFCARGGRVKSAAKLEASRRNLAKTREVCAEKRKVGQGLPWSRSPKPQ